MNPNDHGPPHFHAEAGGLAMMVRVEDLLTDRGRLSNRHQREVIRWARAHQAELRRAWSQASRGVHPDPID